MERVVFRLYLRNVEPISQVKESQKMAELPHLRCGRAIVVHTFFTSIKPEFG